MKIVLLILLLIFFTACNVKQNDKILVQTSQNQVEFEVEIADSVEERAQGLMNRKSMLDNQGMFFIFPKPDNLTFWMKNTYLPLDMIFIDQDWQVVKIAKTAQPCLEEDDKKCPYYRSEVNAQYVLEIKAGLAENKGIKEGDKISLITS